MLTLLASLLLAQTPDSLRGSVTGVVFDSIAHTPLASAEVQFVRADSMARGRVYATTTDAAGRYRVDSLPRGEYIASFFHPQLDSLGVTMRPVPVTVVADRATRLTLALPSATTVQRQVCDPKAISDTTALLLGYVHDAATLAPRDSAQVRIEWADLYLVRGALQRDVHTATVPVRSDGWFAACGVPAGGSVTLRAIALSDTSARIPLTLPGRGVVHRDLLIGSAPTRLAGLVHGVTGQPIAGARVWVESGSDTLTTNANGTFAFPAVVSGSRVVQVRAVGYLPTHTIVDLREVPNGSVNVAMTSFNAYLDTVKVTRQRVYSADRTGFERRSRASASGYFFNRDQVDRMGLIRTTDLLHRVPGVVLEPNGAHDVILMHGTRGYCRPEIYIDGFPMSFMGSDFDSSELDFLAPTDRIDGVEVYPHAETAPAQYTRFMGGCGSILFWTAAPDPKPEPPKEKKRRAEKNMTSHQRPISRGSSVIVRR